MEASNFSLYTGSWAPCKYTNSQGYTHTFIDKITSYFRDKTVKFLFLVPRDVSVLQRTGSMKMHIATHIFSNLLTKMEKCMTVCNLVSLRHICVKPASVQAKI